MSRVSNQWARWFGMGAALGLLAFAAETALVLRGSAIGLNIDVSGPFAALMKAVQPHLPSLFARIVLAYVAAGAVLGWGAGALSLAWPRWTRWAGFAVEFGVLVFLLAWHRGIHRPALFDDLEFIKPLLRGWVEAGEPWHPVAVFGGWSGLHAIVGIGRLRRVRLEANSAKWAVPLAVVAMLMVGSLVLPVHARGDTKAGNKLVLLIGIDAFRVDRLSAMGGKGDIAPFLEAFLMDATLFQNAWTPIAQTEPAWRSLLTARWPFRTGDRYPLTAESRWLSASTFPGLLGREGWNTSFSTDCSRFNFQTQDSGFAARHQPPRGAINFLLEKIRYRGLGMVADNALGAALLPELMENRAMAGLYDPDGYARRLAAHMVDAAGQGNALFAFHATAAHFPGDPVFPFYRRFVREDAPFQRRLRMFFSPITGGAKASASGWNRQDSEALYDELLAQADAQLGTLLEALKQHGLYEEATVVVFSDHGESFHADHPELADATPVHGARLSREENQILLAVKLPRSQGGAGAPRRVDALVRLVDIGPTLLEVAGAPTLPDADGVSLMPLLRGDARELGLRLYAETGFTHASPAAFDPGHMSRASRTFDIYRVRPDGVVELHDRAHEDVMADKDFGAFDGRRWIVRAPREDGTVAETCTGECPAPELGEWLGGLTGIRQIDGISSSSL